MDHTRDFTRDGCTVGARLVSYRHLEEWYVCRECGGQPAHHIGRTNGLTINWAECADCGARDFISLRYYEQQCADYPVILAGLPPELRALFSVPEPSNVTADQAIAELYDY